MNKIKEIRYPNTVKHIDQKSFEIGWNCYDIGVGSSWVTIYKNKNLDILAEIHINVCEIYYE
jgi:hypothetical protein